jgi:hypothetical protein
MLLRLNVEFKVTLNVTVREMGHIIFNDVDHAYEILYRFC